ncbi:MAG TPA: hypothetical protein VFZ16_19170 [Hyphomicrobiaceae bacterium]|nr:hypothetical protein [Hyphomicrobiaceae bacterium]
MTRWEGVRYLALILVMTAAVPVLAHVLAIALPQLAALAPGLAEAVTRALAVIPLTGDVAKKSYWLAGFVGAYLQGFLTSTASISMAERNVEKFKAMREHLWTTYCRPEVLADVREAAARGDHDRVATYADLVAGDLTTEASDWGAWHRARSELALRLLGQAKPGPGG